MAISLFGPLNTGIVAGGTGTSNATSTKMLVGRVIAVYVRYNHSCPNTADVIVKTVGTSPDLPTQTFLTLTNKNTDGLFMPRTIPHDTSGVALAALTAAEPVVIYDYVNVSVADVNNADSVDIWLLMEE